MKWHLLLSGEARVAIRSPTSGLGAALAVVAGFVFGLLLGSGETGTESFATTVVMAFGGGVTYMAAVVASLIGAGIGGRDSDLGTDRDLWLAGIRPVQHLLCKFVVAVDLAVICSLLIPVGGVFAGIINTFFRGAALYSDLAPYQAQTAASALVTVVIVVPAVAVGAAGVASLLRSRLRGVLVWLGLCIILILTPMLAYVFAPSGYILSFTPVASAFAFVKRKGWGGAASVPLWVLLLASVTWSVLIVALALWRARELEASASEQRKARLLLRTWLGKWSTLSSARPVFTADRPTRTRKHIVVTACLLLLLGGSGAMGKDALVRAGANFDPVHQVLTGNLRGDWLRHLAAVLSERSFGAAHQLVGEAGEQGLALVEALLEADPEARVSWAQESSGHGPTYGVITIERDIVRNGQVTTVGTAFRVDMRFEEGKWRCLGIGPRH